MGFRSDDRSISRFPSRAHFHLHNIFPFDLARPNSYSFVSFFKSQFSVISVFSSTRLSSHVFISAPSLPRSPWPPSVISQWNRLPGGKGKILAALEDKTMVIGMEPDMNSDERLIISSSGVAMILPIHRVIHAPFSSLRSTLLFPSPNPHAHLSFFTQKIQLPLIPLPRWSGGDRRSGALATRASQTRSRGGRTRRQRFLRRRRHRKHPPDAQVRE